MTWGVSSQIDEKFKIFAGMLPHGSGIDCDWNAYQTNQYVYFTNSYHLMDQHGFYSGWQDFTVRVERQIYDAWLDATEKSVFYRHAESKAEQTAHAKVLLKILASNFMLHFNNGERYLARQQRLREYLPDTIFWSLVG